MADCAGMVMQVAILEDGTASVQIPVDNWRDVKGVHGVGIAEGMVGILHADQRVQVYGGPSGQMLDVCVEMLSDEEKAARDQAEADRAHANVDQVHEPEVSAKEAEVQAAQDYKADVVQGDAEDAALAEADKLVAEAEAALAAARQARADAHKEVAGG